MIAIITMMMTTAAIPMKVIGRVFLAAAGTSFSGSFQDGGGVVEAGAFVGDGEGVRAKALQPDTGSPHSSQDCESGSMGAPHFPQKRAMDLP